MLPVNSRRIYGRTFPVSFIYSTKYPISLLLSLRRQQLDLHITSQQTQTWRANGDAAQFLSLCHVSPSRPVRKYRHFQVPSVLRLQGQTPEVFFLLRTLDVDNQGDRTLRNVHNSLRVNTTRISLPKRICLSSF